MRAMSSGNQCRLIALLSKRFLRHTFGMIFMWMGARRNNIKATRSRSPAIAMQSLDTVCRRPSAGHATTYRTSV